MLNMQYTLYTIGTLLAIQSLVAAVPLSRTFHPNEVEIRKQLPNTQAADITNGGIGVVIPNVGNASPGEKGVESVQLGRAGAWCAGFSDAAATRVVRGLTNDGIFDNMVDVLYARNDGGVTIESWWCAVTRPEVEQFVARGAGGNGGGNNGGNDGGGNNNQGNADTATIIRQLNGFDTASTIEVQLDATTPNDRNVRSARMQQPGPWCAGFTDEEAKQPARALNGDGIFDSANEVVYTNDQNGAVGIGSWWCALTRGEVEAFVARARNNGGGNNNGGQTPAAPVNGGGNNGGNNGGGNNNGPERTVRVQLETERGTTFFQENLPANVGIQSAQNLPRFNRPIFDIRVIGEGACDFTDDSGRAINFAEIPREGVQVVGFVCEV
jgi:hypothetical protein